MDGWERYFGIIDGLVDRFAVEWVEIVGDDIDHEWPPHMGSESDDDDALAFIRRTVDEFRDAYMDECPTMHSEYARYLFEGLAFATETIRGGDMW